jgi:NAD(P)-dependent dehydrogenase (short-subunit alcohol dehydrogenase family)
VQSGVDKLKLTDKVAIVTGAGSGIGKACAQVVAARGAAVLVSDIDYELARSVADAIVTAGYRAIAHCVDVADATMVEAMVTAARDHFGGLDIAVNNAGVGGVAAVVADLSLESWRRVMSVNLDGVFYCVRAEARAMRAGTGGSIINVASVLGVVASPRSADYVAAKHGVIGLTKAAALGHATDGIRVNAVGPGYVNTPLLNARLTADRKAEREALHPLGRLGEPDEIAEMVAWLASDSASFATGGFYPVDGGFTAQ